MFRFVLVLVLAQQCDCQLVSPRARECFNCVESGAVWQYECGSCVDPMLPCCSINNANACCVGPPDGVQGSIQGGLPVRAPAQSNVQQFPEAWGFPPQQALMGGSVPLPGGYGHGTRFLAEWILLRLDEDVSKGVIQFPASWGEAPPVSPTDELMELPFGYGTGTRATADWIRQQAQLNSGEDPAEYDDWLNGAVGGNDQSGGYVPISDDHESCHMLDFITALAFAGMSGVRFSAPLFVLSFFALVDPAEFGLSESFQWIGSGGMFFLLLLTLLVEICGDLVPALDNLLHVALGPLHSLLGGLTAVVPHFCGDYTVSLPMAVLGAIFAFGVHSSKAVVRAASTAASCGVLNPFVSLFETVLVLITLVLVLVFPFFAVVCLVIGIYFSFQTMMDGDMCNDTQDFAEEMNFRGDPDEESQLRRDDLRSDRVMRDDHGVE